MGDRRQIGRPEDADLKGVWDYNGFFRTGPGVSSFTEPQAWGVPDPAAAIRKYVPRKVTAETFYPGMP